MLMMLVTVIVDAAQLTSWSLVLFGTATPPHHLADYLSSRTLTTMHTRRTVDSELLASDLHHPSPNGLAHHNVNATAAAGRFATHNSTNTGMYCNVSVSLRLVKID